MTDDPRIEQTQTTEPPRPEEDVADGVIASDDGAAPAEPAFGAEAEVGPAPPAGDAEDELPPDDDAAWFEEPAPDVQEAEPIVAAEPDELAQLRERAGKADEYLALAQRTQADFENFRKRSSRDVAAAEARGLGRLAKELLPALDNLERALAAAESAPDGAEHHLAEGIRLVQAELSAGLARAGIEGYDPKGQTFDPAQHEAMAQTPVEGAETGTIVEVYQQGYRLADTILRPARVVVAA